jgi:tRNA G10  N-methylase Trm11
MVNDPTDSLWEIVIAEDATGKVDIEALPRGAEDSRFTYRRGDVPASSHPTLAAALARIAGVQPDDVVWDPFVGSGSELVERAKLGPYARLFGTDVAEKAIAVARRNLATAGVERAELSIRDARSFRPAAPVTLVITNPPMGRRVLDRDALAPLFDELFTHAARVAAPHARFVWISPLFDRSVAFATRAGWAIALRRRVDMGGFWGELQLFTLAKRATESVTTKGARRVGKRGRF